MEIYLVGGAVRDELLGRTVTERDWVVTGATPDEMLRLGYRQVGKDFPVFLHPQTQEEYALARTERKIGRGYAGFEFDTSARVTLAEDLIRRDLTINAIAKNPKTNELIDPYHGKEDIANKWLRHVSAAFIEDPVRILRVARFAARFAELGFRVAPETNQLMQQMVESGEIDALIAERVWKELERALGEKNPEEFFNVLSHCQALAKLFPAIQLTGQGMQALQRASQYHAPTQVRFAVLLHDLSLSDIEKICLNYRLPTDYQELAVLTAKYYAVYQDAEQLTASDRVKLFRETDVFRREARFLLLLQACEIIVQNVRPTSKLMASLAAAKSVDAKQIAATFKGKEIAEQLDLQRIKAIEKLG